jgi:hypothetical protein
LVEYVIDCIDQHAFPWFAEVPAILCMSLWHLSEYHDMRLKCLNWPYVMCYLGYHCTCSFTLGVFSCRESTVCCFGCFCAVQFYYSHVINRCCLKCLFMILLQVLCWALECALKCSSLIHLRRQLIQMALFLSTPVLCPTHHITSLKTSHLRRSRPEGFYTPWPFLYKGQHLTTPITLKRTPRTRALLEISRLHLWWCLSWLTRERTLMGGSLRSHCRVYLL